MKKKPGDLFTASKGVRNRAVKKNSKLPEQFLATKKLTVNGATALTKLPIKKRVASYGLI